MDYKKLRSNNCTDKTIGYWSLRQSVIDSSTLKRYSSKCKSRAYYESFSISELNIFLRNTPLDMNVCKTLKPSLCCSKFGEKYSGSKIDQIIFGSNSCVNNSAFDEMVYKDAIIRSLVSPNNYEQMNNRRKGLSYLKNLCNSIKDCSVNYEQKSNQDNLTPKDVEFLEEIHKLQNFKPTSINLNNYEEIRKSSDLSIPHHSEIFLKKPDLSKWK